MVHEFIKSPEFEKILELNESLNNFGISGKGFIQNPNQFMNSRTGSNWDYCICEAFKLTNEQGIPVKCYSLEVGNEFINFIVFKHDLFWYWFESFDKENKGIHEFKSWIRLINFVTHKYGVKNSNFKLGLREVNPLDYRVFGMNEDSYKNYLLSHEVIKITDNKIEDPVNYINENGIMRKFSDTNPNGVDYTEDDSVETRLLADEDKFHRRSFNFGRGMRLLKTKGKTFSKKEKWSIFIKKFTDMDMRRSMEQQIQRLMIKSRVAIDPNEKMNYLNEANELKREAIEKGYLDVNKHDYLDTPEDTDYLNIEDHNFSDQDQNKDQTSTPNPPKPENMDHQENSNGKTTEQNNSQKQNQQDNNQQNQNQEEPPRLVSDITTKTDGSFQGQLGQKGGLITPDAMKNNMSPSAQEQAQPQQQTAGNKFTVGNIVKKMIPSLAVGMTGRWVGRALGGLAFGV